MTRGWFSCHTGELGSPTKTVTYRYDDADWGDLLTEYDGNAITYDQIGNPLTHGDRTYTWRHGRQLATLTENGTTWTNTYNAGGLRTRRTDGTDTYVYVYDGSSLAYMSYNDKVMRFAHAPDGTPLSIVYQDRAYYYVTNLQGDVVGLVNSSGVLQVAYSYDAWGNILSTTGPMATTLGAHNPLRYRGYVYDSETGFYYVSSRYYDPEIGRFINADAFTSTGQGILGNNMFAYCGNNPIVRLDLMGTRHCAATSISKEKVYERRYACYWQKQVTLEKYNPKPIGSYSKGNVYLVGNEDDVYSNFPGDIVVLDRRGPDKNDGVEIRYSFLVSDKNQQREILTLLYELEEDNPTGWIRTVDSMMTEWDAHNDSYSILSFTPFTETRNRAAHVFFNNCEEGWSYWDHTVGRVLTGQ